MTNDDTGTGGTQPEGSPGMPPEGATPGAQPEETSQAGPSGVAVPLGRVPAAEQLMALGALLIILVTDLLGDIILDEYGVGQVTWIVAVAVVAAIWAHRLGGAQMPVAYRSVMIVLGYAGLIMGIREFLEDIEASVLDAGSVVFALATYLGALLLGIGAYQSSRSS